MAVKYQPEGYHSLTPYLRTRNAGEAIEFYKKAFDAKEKMRMPGPDGKGVMHAELTIGDSTVMLSEPMQGENRPGEMTGVMIYVRDTDKTFKQALQAGAQTREEPQDMFWGDRMAVVRDPFGHEWMISTHIEDVSEEETARRMKKEMAGAR